jgi:acetyltransferase-like isoleucine patch superfamily enzyme
MEYNISVTDKIKELFRQHKVYVQEDQQFNIFGGNIHFDDSLCIEPYVEMIATSGDLWSMGTSSYMNYSQFPANTVVGRFCSIGNRVGAMPQGHSFDRFTSSPITSIDETIRKYGTVGHRYGFSPFSLGTKRGSSFQTTTWNEERRPIVIDHDVWIANDTLIKPGVHIGNGAVVGNRSIVTHDVEPYAVVAGSPAVVRKMRFSDSNIERLEKLAWWRYPLWEFEGVQGGMAIEAFIDQVENLLHKGKLLPYQPEPLTAQMLLDAANR